jgi:hypothetical protein
LLLLFWLVILLLLSQHLGLLAFEFSDLDVDIHLLLVEDGLILNPLVKEESELARLMQVVNQGGDEDDLLFLGESLNVLAGSHACQLDKDLLHGIFAWTKRILVLTSQIGQDESCDLRPQLLLLTNDLVDGL